MNPASALHAAQATSILDALEVLVQCPHALTVTRDAYGVAVVRSGATGETWRGSSVRDALAQFVQSRDVW